MEHQRYFKQKGVKSRACSKCGGDLGDRYGKQAYCKACHAAYMREHRPKHSDLPEEARKKANARAYARVYLNRGKIQRKKCQHANCKNNAQMHHEDYNKPTEVMWFCRKHHLELHRK